MAWRELLIPFKSVGVGEQTQPMWGWFLGKSPCTSQPFCGTGSSVQQHLSSRRVKPLHWPLATWTLCTALCVSVKKQFVTPCTLCRELINPFKNPPLCFLLVWGVPWLPKEEQPAECKGTGSRRGGHFLGKILNVPALQGILLKNRII